MNWKTTILNATKMFLALVLLLMWFGAELYCFCLMFVNMFEKNYHIVSIYSAIAIVLSFVAFAGVGVWNSIENKKI